MLADSNTEVETLQEALVQAQDELAVSVAFHLGYIELALITLLYVTSETKTTCHSKQVGAWDEVVTQFVVELLSHRTLPLSMS
jgi:hypothetical protein